MPTGGSGCGQLLWVCLLLLLNLYQRFWLLYRASVSEGMREGGEEEEREDERGGRGGRERRNREGMRGGERRKRKWQKDGEEGKE